MCTQEWLFHGSKKRGLQCTWFLLLQAECLANGRGMVGWEWEHWRHEHRLRAAWEPMESNTLFALAGKQIRGGGRGALACLCRECKGGVEWGGTREGFP